MDFGRTGGRGLESPAAPYVFGALILCAAALWIWVHFDHRRKSGDNDEDGKD